MRIRPLATAAAAALVLGVGGPAAATTASSSTPAAGKATTGLTLLSLALAGHDVRVGSVALTSSTVGSAVSKVVVTPVNADGKAYGEQTVTPASSPASVPSFDSAATLPAALKAVASVKSPVFNVSASNSPAASSKAGAASLGSVSVLGLPVALNGTVDVSSLVDGKNALGNKTVSVKNLALPSIADILAALGLDLSKLPTKTLTDLVNGLDLATTATDAAAQALAAAEAALGSAFTTAQSTVDSARAAVTSATSEVAAKTTAADQALAAKNTADQQVQSATISRDTALATFNGLLGQISAAVLATLPAGSNTPAGFSALTAAQQAAVEAAVPGITQAAADYAAAANALASAQSTAAAAAAASAAANTALSTAQAALTAAQAALNTALSTLNSLLTQLAPQINALLAAVTAVLDGTPLVSVDSFTVQTKAMANSAAAGGQVAEVVGGEIQGVHVLGTDVLNNVLGTSKVNVLDLAGSTLSQVTSQISAVTGVLSSVLSAVPGLSIPAPTVQLLTKSTSTSISGGYGNAQNTVKALSISIPAITLPAALALPNAATLPAISGAPNLGITAVGDLTSQAMTLSVGTMSEQASFRPAAGSSTTPPAAGPPLATTGMPAGVAVLGLLLVGFGLVVRRRLTAEG